MATSSDSQRRGFGLRRFLLWQAMLFLGLASLRLGYDVESQACGLFGTCCVLLWLVIGFVVLQRVWKHTATLTCLALCVYVAVYTVLSRHGRYEPATIGSGGVKGYAWAPLGFYRDLGWRHEPLILFAPLYWSDQALWHTHEAAYSGTYPRTAVDPKDIWKYYPAEGLVQESLEAH